MNIISDIHKDVRSTTRVPGGYEWWYFDAINTEDKYRFAIIFYEGNPFSNRYIKQLEDDSCPPPDPSFFPAVSISVYEDENPIYYSFTEFEKWDCSFGKEFLAIEMGSHKIDGAVKGDLLIYKLELDEILPCGDQIQAELTFTSSVTNDLPFNDKSANSVGHQWNLVQPRAEIEGKIILSDTKGYVREIEFEGRGYHDHNTGNEPMRDEFKDWYWGRIHFDYATLVFYVMNRKASQQHQAWLIDNSNSHILLRFDDISLLDREYSIFGLVTARKIVLHAERAEVHIQQSQLLDNGPFYQRYKNDGFLRITDEDILESVSGISEYIHPDRIYSRVFWPLVNMRIRYTAEGTHWVQRSKTLYRWTW